MTFAAQNLSDMFKMFIEHVGEITALPLSDVMWQNICLRSGILRSIVVNVWVLPGLFA